MDTLRLRRTAFSIIGATLLGLAPCRSDEMALMSIPARYTIVQLAFDVAKLRPMTLVAYDDTAGGAEPVMHVWDGLRQDWLRTDMAAYRTGSMLGARVQHAIVIGSNETTVNKLADSAGWALDVTRIPTLSIVTVVNTLNGVLHFSPNEWRWLAARHGLQIKDLNSERRRWGRYGPPGTGARAPRSLPAAELRPHEAPEVVAPRAVEQWEDEIHEPAAPLAPAMEESRTPSEPQIDVRTPAPEEWPEDK